MNEACSRIVQRDDPHLYATALFAPEPARSRLMVLYAFDCELARAAGASKEVLISRMRLQWWRNVIVDAPSLRPDHDVAGPLVDMIRVGDFGGEAINDLVAAHEDFLDHPVPEEAYRKWALRRYGVRMGLSSHLLGTGRVDTPLLEAASVSQGYAFVFRNIARMATEGQAPVVELVGADLAQIARGQLGKAMSGWCRRRAIDYSAQWRSVANGSRVQMRRLAPVFLPMMFQMRTLCLVAKDPEVIFGKLNDIDRPFDGIRLAWHATTGRW